MNTNCRYIEESMDGSVVRWCCAMERKWPMPFGSSLKTQELSWGLSKENSSVDSVHERSDLFQGGAASK